MWGIVLKKSISIRWKVLLYVLSFTLGIFLLLWIFQTIFLGWFYENIRIGQVKDAAQSVELNINNEENLESIITSVSQNNDVCVRVVYGYGQDLSSDFQQGCAVSKLTVTETVLILDNTINNDGEYLEKKFETLTLNTIFGNFRQVSDENYDLIYSKIIDSSEDGSALVMVSARMTPVNATISTIRTQLGYIGFILLTMSIVLTTVITSRIIKPLERMSKSALILSTGNYDVQFEGSQYKEVKELSESLNYAAKKLKDVDQHRRDLIANVSHDLRTPLTMIGGYGEMMRDIPEENNKENAQVIIDETKRLTSLVNDLLDFSKLQEHKIRLNIDEFNISEVLRNTCHMYNQTFSEKGISLIYEGTSEYIVKADSSRIQQVINNFINNALHYGSSGEKVIVRQIDNEKTVRVEIQDFGEGIEKDKLEFIWDRYYKIDKTHVRSMSGSGLGLSIVKEILNLHQVKFGVLSKVNEGSIFYFELEKVKNEI